MSHIRADVTAEEGSEVGGGEGGKERTQVPWAMQFRVHELRNVQEERKDNNFIKEM